MRLETKRLLLRPWIEEDAEALYKYASDPLVGPRAGWAPHQSVEESREIIRGIFGGEGMWAVVLKETEEPIGCVGYLGAEVSNLQIAQDECEVGYWIARPYWGRGICTEALRAVVEYGLRDKGFKAMWGNYFPTNPASGRVMEKCGFVDTGKETTCPNLEVGSDQPVRIMKLNSSISSQQTIFGGNTLLAPCGLDCAQCDARKATLNNDDTLRAKTAELWNKMNHFDLIKPQHINCMGCLADGVKTYFCAELCAIRKCALKKGLVSCHQCGQKHTCGTLAQITDHSPEAKIKIS